MPLVYSQNIHPNCIVAAWFIEEGEDYFLQHIHIIETIAHPHKRLQHLAGRYLLQKLLPHVNVNSIRRTAENKPYLPDQHFQFSISHCKNLVAVIACTGVACGIDVEAPRSSIMSVSAKFIHKNEIDLLTNKHMAEEEAATIIWSAKEAIFKWYGKGQVDFKEHIRIHEIQVQHRAILVNASFLKECNQPLQLQGVYVKGQVLLHVMSQHLFS